MSGPISIINRLILKRIKTDLDATNLLFHNTETKEVSSMPKNFIKEILKDYFDEKLDKGNYIGTAETLSYQSKIYENGQLQIFRKPGTPPDPTNKEPNVGDWCIGFVENQFINAEYLGPNKLLLTSYNI